MHPVILSLPIFEIRSYYVMWITALLVFVFLTRNRAVSIYGMERDKVTSVIVWVYVGGVIGALFGNIAERLPLFFEGVTNLRSLFSGGLSSGSGFFIGGFFGIYRLKKLGMSVNDFADSSAAPAALMVAIGRIGCFLEGCCMGVGKLCSVKPWWGMHFPHDSMGFYRYPSQMSESIAAFIIFLTLIFFEKRVVASKHDGKAVLMPLFLILYGMYRLIFDNLRAMPLNLTFRTGHLLSIFAIFMGLAWFYLSVRKKKT